MLSLRATLLSFIFVFTASAQQAELVWVETKAASYDIHHSQLINERWQVPKAIYSSSRPISSPSIGRLADGSSILLWSELKESSTALMSTIKPDQSEIWDSAHEIKGLGKENMASLIIHDTLNQAWAVWSSNDGEDDDIYLAKIDKDGWSAPIQINQDNAVPDILPTALINQSGEVEVRWQSLDLPSLTYVSKSKVVDSSASPDKPIERSKDALAIVQNKDMSLDDILLPNFLPVNSGGQLYFPNNRSQQSVRIQ